MAYDENKLVKLGALKQVAAKTKDVQDSALTGVKVNGTALAIASHVVDILIATGTANGTISVNSVDVAVKGLAALAYKSEVELSDLAEALRTTINTHGTNLTTLIGSDTGKSVREVSADEVAKVVAGADQDFDTLKEIADWILSDKTGAAKMQSDISALNTKVALGKDGDGKEYVTVKAYVEAVTNGLIKLDALSAETTGTGNAVTALSYSSTTGKFTATKGETFVLASQIATDAEVTEMLTEVFGA